MNQLLHQTSKMKIKQIIDEVKVKNNPFKEYLLFKQIRSLDHKNFRLFEKTLYSFAEEKSQNDCVFKSHLNLQK